MPSEVTFVRIEAKERESLFPLRADQWHGSLTTDQYIQRNTRLFDHPYGKRNIQSWALRNSRGEFVSSMDTLDVTLATSSSKTIPASHIASFITDPKHRGNAYGKRLIVEALAKNPSHSWVLFSDIEPEYYAKLGFRGKALGSYEQPTFLSKTPAQADCLKISEFVSQLTTSRLKMATKESPVLIPSDEMMDWHLERYRYFGSLIGRPMESDLFWQMSDGHLLAGFVDPIAKIWDCWWIEVGCNHCMEFARDKAARSGVPRIRFWDEWTSGAHHREMPMALIPGLSVDCLANCQPCDYW